MAELDFATPPDRSMGAVFVRSFLFFAGAFLLAFVLAFVVFGFWRKSAGAPDENILETAATAAYMLLVTAVPPAAGFALVASPFPSWRNLSPRRVAWLSAAAGLATYLAQTTGLSGFLFWIPLPLGHGEIGAAIRLLLPGIAIGLVAVGIARWLSSAPVPSPKPEVPPTPLPPS